LAQNDCAASAGTPDFPLDPRFLECAGAHIVIAVSMSRSAADLPEDPAELRRFAGALAAEVHTKTLLIEKLRMQLSILRRARFGRSSEKLDREIEQLELLLGDIEESDAERQARTEASDAEAFFHPAVEEAVRPHASARSSAARDGPTRSALHLPDLRRDEVRSDRRR
jgi:Transposase C of IS166 homeodomain